MSPELKWCGRTGLDALDEVLWDCFKFAHARATLDGVEEAFLIYAAPTSAWEIDGRFRNLFDATLVFTETVLSEHANVWRWLLRESSKSRPMQLPPALEMGQIAANAFMLDGVAWELRVASVAPNGEPWIELEDGSLPTPTGEETYMFEWPYPEPGPGMVPDDPADDFQWPSHEPPQVPNEDLGSSDVPGPKAPWNEITWFAAQYDGYAHCGDTAALGRLANNLRLHWREQPDFPDSLSLGDMRACLFFEYRRHHHLGHAPDTASAIYIRALVDEVGRRLGGERKAKGSLSHIRAYVNEDSEMLDAAIFSAAPSLVAEARGDLRWVSPLASDGHLECWNERFLERLDLLDRLQSFQEFWPFSGSGTPHWDALATVPTTDGVGVVMVEAKAHRGELVKPGDATGSTGSALAQISRSCTIAREFFGVPADTRPWETSYYQVGNRLAHLYWMVTKAQMPTWLVWVFIVNDPVWSDALTAHQWHAQFEAVKHAVGLRSGHPLEHRIAAVYLPPSQHGGTSESG